MRKNAPWLQNLDAITRFLLLCLRGRFEERALDEARAWFERSLLDWDQVAQRIYGEALTPLCYALLREQRWLPQAIAGHWHEVYMHNAMRNMLFLVELERILRALDGVGVSAIVLKGGALMESIYSNVAPRPMSDLDLLVRRKDLPAAIKTIEALGYAPRHQEERPGIAFAYENEIALQRPGREDMPLELHWSLFDSPFYQQRLSMDWFWQTAHSAVFEGARALILGPEAQLLHLSAHLALHHHGQGLRWSHDIAEVVYHYRTALDWDMLLKQVRQFQLILPLQKTLPLMAQHWGVPVPQKTLAQLAAFTASSDEQRIFHQMTAPNRSVARRFWHDLSAMSGWRRRLWFLERKLFPATAYMRQRYQISSAWLTPFFYPYRWWLGMQSIFHKDT